MYKFAALVLLASVTSTAWGQEEATEFDPYNGTTINSTGIAATSNYLAKSTPSGETQPASALGLTPGFWKQKQHFYAWTGYAQTDSFKSIFGVGSNDTLLKELSTGGGHVDALNRHAVAALLNSTSSYVNYAYTKDEIIAMVQDAYATGNFEATKDLFDKANNAGGEIPKY